MPIIANLILGRDGGTSIRGRSAPLSSSSDRKRFHELRAMSDAIVIGGETARCEPYGKTPVPLIVVTRSQEVPGAAHASAFSQCAGQDGTAAYFERFWPGSWAHTGRSSGKQSTRRWKRERP